MLLVADPKINKAIAALFLKYIEEDKNIRLNLRLWNMQAEILPKNDSRLQ